MNEDYAGRTDNKRRSWTKVVDLILRSWHIGTSSVLFGAVVFAVPYAQYANWHHLAIATGCVLIIFNIYKSRHWPYQGRGLMAWMHVGLVGLAHVRTVPLLPLLAIALAVGVIGSHTPGSIRHWSLVHRRRID